ncbi:hypothetical protein [Xanthomonas bromi]|nr:hypothetical protein [Xanthomonas bromi]
MQLAHCAGFCTSLQRFPRGAALLLQLASLGRSARHCRALSLHCAMQRSAAEGPLNPVMVSFVLSGLRSANGTGAAGGGASLREGNNTVGAFCCCAAELGLIHNNNAIQTTRSIPVLLNVTGLSGEHSRLPRATRVFLWQEVADVPFPTALDLQTAAAAIRSKQTRRAVGPSFQTKPDDHPGVHGRRPDANRAEKPTCPRASSANWRSPPC